MADIPASTRLRLSVQWREPHDPDFLRHGQDVYRRPLAAPRLTLLRQLDPTGTKQPADDFQVVAQTVGLPQRLDNQPDSAVYEQTVEFTVAQAGRYALRVEGRVPATIRPPDQPTVPAAEKTWELRLRVFVDDADRRGRGWCWPISPPARGASAPRPTPDRRSRSARRTRRASRWPGSASGSAFGMELLAEAGGAESCGRRRGGGRAGVEPGGGVRGGVRRECHERRHAGGEIGQDDGDRAGGAATCAGGPVGAGEVRRQRRAGQNDGQVMGYFEYPFLSVIPGNDPPMPSPLDRFDVLAAAIIRSIQEAVQAMSPLYNDLTK